MNKATVESVKAWCVEEKEGIDRGLEESPDVPPVLKKFQPFRSTWAAGCWLMYQLEEAGCPEDQRHRIGFAHGQRSVFGDPFEVAAQYFNEWSESSRIPEEPGNKLASKIMDEVR